MDDGLLWAKDDPMLTLHYFRCVCEVFMKYWVSFNPKKCDFFKQRFEWLGNDLLPDGNHPVSSKFNLINDWPHLATGISLLSFIGLITFYSHTSPTLILNSAHCATLPSFTSTNPFLMLPGQTPFRLYLMNLRLPSPVTPALLILTRPS